LNDHYCQCRKYSAFHYPCSHIIATCGYVSMNYFQYVDIVYTNEHILKTYSLRWWSLGNKAAPSNEPWILIPDPSTIRAKGRPKATRMRNEMDWLEPSEHRQKCSKCEREGHNKRRLSNVVDVVEKDTTNGFYNKTSKHKLYHLKINFN